MSVRHFLVTLLAINLSFHLLRFPHLILENGGGAFLLIFFIVLNLLALPLIVCERVLDRKLNQIDLNSLMNIKKTSPVAFLDRTFFFLWYGLRVVVLTSLLILFLFLSARSIQYFLYFLGFLFSEATATSDLAAIPQVEISFFGALIWVSFSFFIFYRFRSPFLNWSNQWALPMSFAILFVMFLKVILSVQDYEALKVLFYPDFSALNRLSLINLVGHSLACLFVGVGFYKLLKVDAQADLVEIFINAIIQALSLGVLIGVMALPMIDQVSETAFGSNWIFSIVPRWLSYGEHGFYYCGLFFMTISYVCFHVCVTIWRVLNHNALLMLNLKSSPRFKWIGNISFIVFCSLAVFFLQRRIGGWSGQSLMLTIDNLVIDVGLPMIALMMLWIVFRYTRKSEQSFVFEQQQVLFHNRYFFKIWRVISLGFVPTIILLGWFLKII